MKINLKKLISIALVAVMLVCTSLLTISVNALVIDTVDSNGETYNVEFYSRQSPYLQIKSRESVLTPEETSKLIEALKDADYNNYEIITGTDYEIKHIPLKHGYSLDFTLIYEDNISIIKSMSNSATITASAPINDTRTGTARISIKDTNNLEVGYVIMTVTFYCSTNSSGQNMVSVSNVSMPYKNPPSATWSNITYSIGGSDSTTRSVLATPTLNISGYSPIIYTMSVSCDVNGNISSVPIQ